MCVFYTRAEEFFHAVTHGAGAVLAAIGGLFLLQEARGTGDPWRLASFAIYGATLVLLYTVSTLYHGVSRPGLKAKLRVLDHAAIYLLIAGSYTPFILLRLRGPWGWTLLALVWAVALAGVIYKLTLLDRFPRFSTASYLAMGWMALAAAAPLAARLGAETIAWILAGGVIYTAGTLIYHYNRIRHAHVVWHMFVLAGSVCHFVAIAGL